MIEKIINALQNASFWADETFDEDGYSNDDAIEVVNLHTAIEIVQEVAKEYMHSCYDCKWECLDGCSLRRDSNGNRKPVYDGLTDCKDFEQKGE